MFSPDDTIVAIATPAGRGGLGVVRVSGSRAPAIAAAILSRRAPLAPRHATFTTVRACSRRHGRDAGVDSVVATLFPAPASYTGEDVLEISAHGSPQVLRTIVQSAIDAGARLAQPGEFTLRAFLSGKLDLVQAEAVADLIDAATPLQARIAFDQLEGTLTRRIAEIDAGLFDLVTRLEASLDFPDEGYHFVEPQRIAEAIEGVVASIDALLADAARGRLVRDGATVVIAGRPNVGKSTLFNALAGCDRAIVTDVSGTTRDLLTERVDIAGIAVTLVDTAGARDAVDAIEREGVARGAKAREVADLVIVLFDGSAPLTEDDDRLLRETAGRTRLLVVNKADRPSVFERGDAIRISAARNDGVDELRASIAVALARGEPLRDTAAISNLRHVRLLEEARGCLTRALSGAAAAAPEEFLLADLQEARARFDEIVGTRTPDDVLRHIFERFCIGK